MVAGRWRRVAAQAGWGLGDQALSSLTNFLLGFSVARTTGPSGLGAFSLAFATYTLMLNASQGLGTEPLVVRYSASSDAASWRLRVRQATGVPIALGVAAGLGCLLVAWVTTGPMRGAFLALGVTFPGLLLQDSWRSVFFARRRAVLAFLNDLVWAAVLLTGLGVLRLAGQDTVFWLTATWGIAASVGAVLGVFQSGALPRPFGMAGWLREERDLAPRYLGELVIGAASEPLSFYAIGAVAGLTAVGAIRGAQILLGPLYVAIIGMRLAAMPEAVRVAKDSLARLVRLTRLFAALIVAGGLAWGTVVFLLPDDVGTALLRATWEPAHAVIVPVTLAMTASGLMGAAVIGMRALAAARRSFFTKVANAPVIVGSAAVGATIGGVHGAAWGMAAGISWSAAMCWLQFARALIVRRRASMPAADTGVVSDVPVPEEGVRGSGG